jgi:hypothetical protein
VIHVVFETARAGWQHSKLQQSSTEQQVAPSSWLLNSLSPMCGHERRSTDAGTLNTEKATESEKCQEEEHQSGRRETRAPSAEASGLPGGVSHLMGGVGGGGSRASAAAAIADGCCCALSPLACGLSTFGRLSSADGKLNPKLPLAACLHDCLYMRPTGSSCAMLESDHLIL